MFVERWYSVGDTVVLIAAGVDLQGVVEDVSLRRTRLRSLNGEVIGPHSQITAARVLPSGLKELAIELFVSKRDEGERLVEEVAHFLPEGPTTFVRRPWIESVEELSHVLTGSACASRCARPRMARRGVLQRPAEGARRHLPDRARPRHACSRRTRHTDVRARQRHDALPLSPGASGRAAGVR